MTKTRKSVVIAAFIAACGGGGFIAGAVVGAALDEHEATYVKWPGHEEGWTPQSVEGWTPPKVREEKPAAKPSTEDDVKWPGH